MLFTRMDLLNSQFLDKMNNNIGRLHYDGERVCVSLYKQHMFNLCVEVSWCVTCTYLYYNCPTERDTHTHTHRHTHTTVYTLCGRIVELGTYCVYLHCYVWPGDDTFTLWHTFTWLVEEIGVGFRLVSTQVRVRHIVVMVRLRTRG